MLLQHQEFDDTLVFGGMVRCKHPTATMTRASNGEEVKVFLVDFDEVVRHMVRGRVSGHFKVVKRGQCYGVRLVEVATLPST